MTSTPTIDQLNARPTLSPRGRFTLCAGIALITLATCATPSTPRCGLGERPMLSAQLFFGRSIGNRAAVTDAQFNAFDQVFARRFPTGLTRVNAIGHWQAASNAPIARERSDVVTVVVADGPEARRNLEAIRQAYMVRFRQESVLLTHQPVCARL